MKHIEFTTTKGDFLVIEDDRMDYDAIHDSKFKHALYQLIGGIQDITEEQAKEVVENHILFEPHSQITHKELFFDYMADVFSYTYTALESLHSLLEANGVVFENPICILDGTDKHNNITWLKAQSKVWNKPQTYLFKKI